MFELHHYTPHYFKCLEFCKCNPACDINDMDDSFLVFLDRLREGCGFPLKLNSAYRSLDWELSHGRDGSSSHTKGLAADIACNDSTKRLKIVCVALELSNAYKEWNVRIGIAKNYIHLDIDMDKPASLWLY